MLKICLILTLACAPGCRLLAVKSWGDNCTHPDECYDHRMTCKPDEFNISKCMCNQFHEWNGTRIGCVQIYDVQYIMNKTVTVHDNAEKLNKIQELMFRGPIYSVVFMIFVITTCTLSIITYCLYIRKKDNRLKNYIREMQESSRRKRNTDDKVRTLLTTEC